MELYKAAIGRNAYEVIVFAFDPESNRHGAG